MSRFKLKQNQWEPASYGGASAVPCVPVAGHLMSLVAFTFLSTV